MKRLFWLAPLLIVAVPLCAFGGQGILMYTALQDSPSNGPVFIVETAQGLGTNGGTTSAINTTGANFLVACVTNLESVPTTLSDSASNAWTLVRTDNPGSQVETSLYYVYAPTTSATHTFTLAGTASKSGISVLGFSNIASNPLDQQNGANSSGNNTSFGPGSVAPTSNNEIVVPCVGNFINPSASTVTIPGFAGLQQFAYASTQYAGASAYQIQTLDLPVTPLFSWTGTSAAQAASEASFISNGSAITDCRGCAYISAASTNSGGSGVASDPTSLTAGVNTGTFFFAVGWHTNWSGSGTTTVTSVQPLIWHSCLDGSTNAFTDLRVTTTTGISCNYAFTGGWAGNPGATITATDCASPTCTTLGGIYTAYSGVFIPRAWDAFCNSTYPATSGTGANNMTSGICSPTQANDLAIIFCNNGNSTGETSAGTTPIAFASLASRQNVNGASTDAIYSSASPVIPSITGASTSAYACVTLMLK